MKQEIPYILILSINGKHEVRDVKNYAYTIYDKEGLCIYKNTFNRTECWWEYNKAGVVIHYKEKYSDGKILEEITKFNEAGKKVYYRNDFEGPTETFYDYTEDGKLLSVTHKNGSGRFLEYDNNGKLIYQYRKNSKGEITWEEHYKYDENGNKIQNEAEDDEFVSIDEDIDSDTEEQSFFDDNTTNQVISDDQKYFITYKNGIITEVREKIKNEDGSVEIFFYKV